MSNTVPRPLTAIEESFASQTRPDVSSMFIKRYVLFVMCELASVSNTQRVVEELVLTGSFEELASAAQASLLTLPFPFLFFFSLSCFSLLQLFQVCPMNLDIR